MTRIVLSREVVSAVLGRPCPTCGGDTDAEDHPCAKTQRPIKPCRADLWNAHPRFDGPHDWHFFHYGPNDRYTGSCTGSGDGSHCNCSMTQDVCHWCGLEWLGDGEVRCPDCSGGVLPPESEWVVVEGDYCKATRDGDCTWTHCPQLRDGEPVRSGRHCPLDTRAHEAEDEDGPAGPPADLVEAARAGERVDLAVKCETCEKPDLSVVEPTGVDHGVPFWSLNCPQDGCSDGLVVLGTATVVEVLPIVGFGDHATGQHLIVIGQSVMLLPDEIGPGTAVTAQFASYDLTTIVGRWAIRLTDARRAE